MNKRGRTVFIPIYSTLSVLGSLMIFAFLFVAQKLAEHNIHFYINYHGITIGKIYVVLVWSACLLFITGLNVFLHRNFSNMFLKGIILLCVLTVACYMAFSMLFNALFFMPRSYVGFHSSDGEHRIVVGEDERLSAPYGGTVYERTSRVTIRKIGKYETGSDLNKPFSAGKYYVDWNETGFDVHYDYDGTGENYKTVTYQYLK